MKNNLNEEGVVERNGKDGTRRCVLTKKEEDVRNYYIQLLLSSQFTP